MNTVVELKCKQCKKIFVREKRQTYKKHTNDFCSRKCLSLFYNKEHHGNCGTCNKPVVRTNGEHKKSKSGLMFCNRSCSAKHSNKVIPKRQPEGSCKICSKTIRSSRMYCSKTCRKLFEDTIPRIGLKNRSKNVVSWRQRVKLKAVQYKGGCCQCCGYDKCVRALTFHHIDPSKKDFSIGVKGSTRAWDKVVKELDKCVLLCQNCHSETHDGLHPKYLIKE